MHNSGNVRLNLINLKTRKITKITYSDILAEYLRVPTITIYWRNAGKSLYHISNRLFYGSAIEEMHRIIFAFYLN